jgi:hypothetical protein
VVGHNMLSGSSPSPGYFGFCDATVMHDFKVNGVSNTFECQIGDPSQKNLDYTDNFYICNGGRDSACRRQSPSNTT